MMQIGRYAIPLFVLLAGLLISPTTVQALLPQHSGFGCLGCHNLHGGTGGALLAEADSESTCLSCHGPLGVATEVTIHDPNTHGTGNLGYITCLECHNPHNNNRLNANAGNNIKLIGVEFDFNDTGNPRTHLAVPQIREESPLSLGVLKDVVFETSPADWSRSGDGLGLCNTCHGATHNVGADCTSCHAHDGGFAGAGCTGCHDGLGAGALSISAASPHSETITGYSCEDCHTRHSAGTIEIPNNTTVGINYGSNGESGIALGSSVATGDNEAEICWGCHDTEGVSEWGTNTQTSTGSSPYDYGSVNPGSGVGWYADTTPGGEVGSTWFSANFGYKSGAIQSTHSVDGTATTPGLDPIDNIRCSYCHDVHDLNTLVSDDSSGKPYLRGTWMGNPYREDGAPQFGTIYTAHANFGEVPRGGPSSVQLGGYQIDSNNDDPTTGWTLTDSAGLCVICHSSNVDSMNYFDVDETGTAELPSDSWVGANGHSNAVLGGTGLVAANIFREDWRKPNDGYCPPGSGTDVDGNDYNDNSYCAGYPNMAYQQMRIGGGWAGGFRGAKGLGGHGFMYQPIIGENQPFAYNAYSWGATVDDVTTNNQYHEFSCSKCHNPHASRLPRLMMTNCLDVSHNTWDDLSTITAGDTVTISGVPTSKAQDCKGTINSIHTVVGSFYSSQIVTLPTTAFTQGCNNKDATIVWKDSVGTTLFSGTLPVSFTDDADSGSGFDEIDLSDGDNFTNFLGRETPPTGTGNLAGLSSVKLDNDNLRISMGTSAQNCHRYIDWNGNGDTSDAGDQKGWNNVTPW
jgi:predicted CXXCH cytochrome family protein